ncbi:hypothetical protein PR048_010722 [Dryococelus australis]|uniref:Uncharacterized protein n=1 Tax=Dryococelus australis TaxID=614101 RepID=A0ABQ9I3J4_9NEOP|nr:hypothetical protein PR048_010722 [Dryococelus australis]
MPGKHTHKVSSSHWRLWKIAVTGTRGKGASINYVRHLGGKGVEPNLTQSHTRLQDKEVLPGRSYGTQQNRGSQKRKTWCCTFSMRLNSSSEKRRREKSGVLWHFLISFMSSSRCSDSRETLRPPTMLRLRLGRALKSVQNVECAGQAGTSAQNVQNMESADQDGTTHQQSRDQDDDDPQLASASKRKTQPLVVSDNEDEVTSNSTPSAMHPILAQDIMKEKIAKLRVELDLTERRKKSLVADGIKHEKASKLRREIYGYEKKLKLKEKQRVYAMKHREN